MSNQVIVTGLGCVGPLGIGLDQTWQNAISGMSCVKDTSSENDIFKPRLYAPVQQSWLDQAYDSSEAIDNIKKLSRKADAFILYSILAAEQAIQQSSVLERVDRERIAVIIGVGMGGLPMIEVNMVSLLTKGPRKVSPYFVPGTLPNMPVGYVSQIWGLKGPSFATSSACASGGHAIAVGSMLLRSGEVDAVIVGGAEACVCDASHAGFGALRALSTHQDASTASKPWDANRDGFVLGEGSAIMVMERRDQVEKFGANSLGELASFGMTSDGYHITSPDPSAEQHYRAMNLAIQKAGLNTADVGYINAHATSTPAGDMTEPKAIEQLYGDQLANVKVSATKSMHGHLLGGAGAYEAVLTLLSLQHQLALPTINLTHPDPDLPQGFNPVALQPQSINTQYALSNSFGFGGTNTSLLFKRAGD